MFGFKRRLRAFLAWLNGPSFERSIHEMVRYERESEIQATIQARHALRCRIDGLRKAKKKHSHLTDKLVELTNWQMELEALTYGPGMESRK